MRRAISRARISATRLAVQPSRMQIGSSRSAVLPVIPSFRSLHSSRCLQAEDPAAAKADPVDASTNPTDAEAVVRAEQSPRDPLPHASSAAEAAKPTDAEEGVRADQTSVDPLAAEPSQGRTEASTSSEPTGPLYSGSSSESPSARPQPSEDDISKAKRSIFIGGLSWNVDALWLGEAVETLLSGTATPEEQIVKSVRIVRNHEGRSKGFGFLELSSPEDAVRLLEEFPEIELDGRKSRFAAVDSPTRAPQVGFPRRTRAPRRDREGESSEEGPRRREARNEPSKTVWVGNLPWKANEGQLEDAFSQFGRIIRINIPESREYAGGTKGFAYVEYSDRTQAVRAVTEVLEGEVYLDDRRLTADYAKTAVGKFGQNRRSQPRDYE